MNGEERLTVALDAAIAAAAQPDAASASVKAALRIAVLRSDYDAQIWLRREMEGFSKDRNRVADLDLHAKLSALIGETEAREKHSRAVESAISRRKFTVDGLERVSGHGVSELETLHRSIVTVYRESVTPGMTPLDTGIASLRHEKEKVAIYPDMIRQGSILGRIQDAAYSYLLDVEASMLAGRSTPDVIARGHQFVQSRLALIAPDAHTALASAQERLLAGDPEAMSQAAGSCRRTIKALADSLYPPGPPIPGDDGSEHDMDDDHYRNRLLEYVRSHKGRSTHAKLLASTLTEMGSRLKALDDLASKGVHSAISESQAESCLTWTFMLAADLLRIENELAISNTPT